ncbi:hypothetical protein RUM44_007330 [Polyplax serrata]|uniref:Uncharacterized protein n=1 Tax=Polyplax serrata TaxID=468196 RepID=A0ABR1B0D8_POLSC
MREIAQIARRLPPPFNGYDEHFEGTNPTKDVLTNGKYENVNVNSAKSNFGRFKNTTNVKLATSRIIWEEDMKMKTCLESSCWRRRTEELKTNDTVAF